jgi:methanethiol S-methyltransferase
MNHDKSKFRRLAIFAYGVAAYALFQGVCLYSVGFLGNFGVPRTLDGAPQMPFLPALLIDLGLLALFAVQHSVMARPAFKRWWTRYVPVEAERSTYVLFSNLAMIVMFTFWQPLGGQLWSLQGSVGRGVAYGIYGLGWAILLTSTFLINHFDLFGLRQVWLCLRGQAYTPLNFQVRSAYRFVRHPLYVGWLTVFWAAPDMTGTRFVFAAMTTAYILIAVRFEERDLVAEHGSSYAEYQRRVPMLIPAIRSRKSAVDGGDVRFVEEAAS